MQVVAARLSRLELAVNMHMHMPAICLPPQLWVCKGVFDGAMCAGLLQV